MAAITYLELLGATASVVWLLRRILRPTGSVLWPVTLAVVVGLTVCQPIGVVGTWIRTPGEFNANRGIPIPTTGWHTVRLWGVPVGVFELTPKRPSIGAIFGVVDPPVGARSFIGPLTNDAAVGNIRGDPDGMHPDWNSLHLYTTLDGGYEYAVADHVEPPYQKLGVGIASGFGLLYWIASAMLIGLAFQTRRFKRSEPDTPTNDDPPPTPSGGTDGAVTGPVERLGSHRG